MDVSANDLRCPSRSWRFPHTLCRWNSVRLPDDARVHRACVHERQQPLLQRFCSDVHRAGSTADSYQVLFQNVAAPLHEFLDFLECRRDVQDITVLLKNEMRPEGIIIFLGHEIPNTDFTRPMGECCPSNLNFSHLSLHFPSIVTKQEHACPLPVAWPRLLRLASSRKP